VSVMSIYFSRVRASNPVPSIWNSPQESQL